jgi:uncharacterized metal-binding protein
MVKEAKMPELPQKKVGIVACSGEELAEGTVTRLAALKVLEQLRPGDTVTICLPLFLAGGEGDRAFARFYPTIAVDGCELRCAARATEMHSGKPAASVVVSELVAENGFGDVQGVRRLNEAGQQAVSATAERVAEMVDELLDKKWSRRAGEFVEESAEPAPQEAVQATCSCGSGIPTQQVTIDGQTVTLVALPLIFQQFHIAGKMPGEATARELLDVVKVYNPIPEDDPYLEMLLREYTTYCEQQGVNA